jgi:hypothetical protein
MSTEEILIRTGTVIGLIILFCCGFIFSSCSLKLGKDQEMSFLRMKTEANHASIERADGIGSRLTVSGNSGVPEWWLGKMAHTQVFLPKMKCKTRYKTVNGKEVKESTTCEEVAPIAIEAKVDAKGGYAGDIINTGTATEYGTAFESNSTASQVWIEAIKAAIERSAIKSAEKKELYKALQSIGGLLTGAKK